MTSPPTETFNVPAFFASVGIAEHPVTYRRKTVIVRQGDACTHVYYLQEGRVQLSVTSQGGREGILALLGPGHFFGEGCLTGHALQKATARATTDCGVFRVAKDQMLRGLHTHHALSNRFIAHLLARNIRVEEDLIDQMFHSAEQRLARALLRLAHVDASDTAAPDPRSTTIAPITQETLAEMVGSTRSRVNVLLKKFERLGFIESKAGLTVHPSLRAVVTSE
jgi:CRP/FNR family cyclic AMP-dependent transcriptional regulator